MLGRICQEFMAKEIDCFITIRPSVWPQLLCLSHLMWAHSFFTLIPRVQSPPFGFWDGAFLRSPPVSIQAVWVPNRQATAITPIRTQPHQSYVRGNFALEKFIFAAHFWDPPLWIIFVPQVFLYYAATTFHIDFARCTCFLPTSAICSFQIFCLLLSLKMLPHQCL